MTSVLVAGSSAGQDDNDRVPRPDVGLSDQLRQVMKYYDSVLDEMRREHKSEISTIRREYKETETRLSKRISQLEAKLSKVSYY